MTERSQADLLESLARKVASLEGRIAVYERANLEQLLGIGLPGRIGSIGSMPTPPPVGGGPITPAAVIQPGAVVGGAIAPGTIVDLTPFASNIRPIELVTTLPTLPDSGYPEGTFVYKTNDVPPRLYKNEADVWVAAVGPNDIQANSLTAAQIAAGAINADEIAAGAITVEKLALEDESGQTLLDAQGFGPTWRRFIKSGLYNGDFASPTASLATDIHNSTNPLPYWTYTQASGTAITGRVAADTAAASGHVVRFTMVAGAAGDHSYVRQITPILHTRRRDMVLVASASVRATADSSSHAILEVILLDRDMAVLSSTFLTAESLTDINADAEDTDTLTVVIEASDIDSDAAFVDIRVGMRRGSAGTSDTATMDVCDVRLQDPVGSLYLPDALDPTEEPAEISRRSGILSIHSGVNSLNPSVTLLNTTGVARMTVPAGGWFEFLNGPIRFGDTVFPTSPISNDLYYRTDLDLWFFYDGTRWLTTQLFSHPFHKRDDGGGIPTGDYFIGTAGPGPGASARADLPLYSGFTDLWAEELHIGFFVFGGGSALSGSHKWAIDLQRHGSGTVMGSVEVNSGSSGTFRRTSFAINALVGSSDAMLQIGLTKTGTPGNFAASYTLFYRGVAT